MIFHFTALTKPRGQKRGQAVNRGDHAGVYDPEENLTESGRLLAQALASRPPQPLAGPLVVVVRSTIPRPKKPVHALPTTKPDIDNIIKLLFDALTGVYWLDDKQIVATLPIKVYGDESHPPGLEVWVTEVKDEQEINKFLISVLQPLDTLDDDW